MKCNENVRTRIGIWVVFRGHKYDIFADFEVGFRVQILCMSRKRNSPCDDVYYIIYRWTVKVVTSI